MWVTAFLLSLSILSAATELPPAVAVTAQLAQRPDWPALRLTLKSVDKRPLETAPSALPWGGRYSMILVAIGSDSTGEVLESPLSSADPLEEEPVTLKPRQTIEGEIDLRARFPTLDEVLKTQDVIVFWSYRFPAKGLGVSRRAGGWALIPRAVTR